MGVMILEIGDVGFGEVKRCFGGLAAKRDAAVGQCRRAEIAWRGFSGK